MRPSPYKRKRVMISLTDISNSIDFLHSKRITKIKLFKKSIKHNPSNTQSFLQKNLYQTEKGFINVGVIFSKIFMSDIGSKLCPEIATTFLKMVL